VVAGPTRYGPDEADTTFLCWGSTYGPLREAVDRLNAAGQPVNMLHLADLWPLPVDALRAAWAQARRVIAVEGNATAQLATLIRSQTSLAVDGTILRYDGRPFTPEYIIRGSGLG
jgi:2-oxoglutarate ferredoxin oxidoreductase subunit alpha